MLPNFLPFAALAAAVGVPPTLGLGLSVTAMSSSARAPDLRISHSRTSPEASPVNSWCSFDGDQHTAQVPALQSMRQHKQKQQLKFISNVGQQQATQNFRGMRPCRPTAG
jgi:hypothetical protein